MEAQPVRKSADSSKGIVFAVAGGVALVILIVVIASSQGNSGMRVQRQTYAVQQNRYTTTPPPPPRGYEELGGKTIGQWMKENGSAQNNEMIKERQKRLQDFRKIDRQMNP
jgi:hypothetical protein